MTGSRDEDEVEFLGLADDRRHTDSVIRAEFTIYPFVEGMALPSYAQVAVDAIVAAGLEPELGPLSQTVTGEAQRVLEAVRAATEAAFREGARRVVVNIEAVER